MNRRLVLGLMLGLLVAGSVVRAQSDIQPPQKRVEVIELSRSLLADRSQRLVLPEILESPFSRTPVKPVVEPGVVSATPVPDSDLDLLRRISPLVTPSGTVVLGGEPILLFGQKRFKVGDTLPIVFEGNSYRLVITSIESTSFTLRLNAEELTRPIKTAPQP